MTSTLRGERGLENWLILWTNSTDRLREMWTKGERGGIKSQKFCGSHKWIAPKHAVNLRVDSYSRLSCVIPAAQPALSSPDSRQPRLLRNTN